MTEVVDMFSSILLAVDPLAGRRMFQKLVEGDPDSWLTLAAILVVILGAWLLFRRFRGNRKNGAGGDGIR